jgi:hypothetical protein
VLCADKIRTRQWLDVMRAAHTVGFRSTATIMFGQTETRRPGSRSVPKACALSAGVNDLGGTLMDESISCSAGGSHGQEMTPQQMELIIRSSGPRSEAAHDTLRRCGCRPSTTLLDSAAARTFGNEERTAHSAVSAVRGTRASTFYLTNVRSTFSF